MAKYYRACAEEVDISFHEIFRFASEIKKGLSQWRNRKAKPIRMQKKLPTMQKINKQYGRLQHLLFTFFFQITSRTFFLFLFRSKSFFMRKNEPWNQRLKATFT